MADHTSFDPTAVFDTFAMRETADVRFDEQVVRAPGDDLRCVFLWGHDCYNCNLFKQSAMNYRAQLLELGLTWFQADVYRDTALGRRFSLHGVPAFYFFRSGKRLGRITGWPGLPQFTQAVQKLQADAQKDASAS